MDYQNGFMVSGCFTNSKWSLKFFTQTLISLDIVPSSDEVRSALVPSAIVSICVMVYLVLLYIPR
jgi:hypothetical protein